MQRENLLEKYGIERVSIPMFINHSIYGGLNPIFTEAIHKKLSTYSLLEVNSGTPREGDAVLIGIIKSSSKRDESLKVLTKKFVTASGDLLASIGEREPFYLTSEVGGALVFQVIIIKNPLIDGKRQTDGKPKVVFDQEIHLPFRLMNNLKSNLSVDDGGVVNFTNNQGNLKLKMIELAGGAANTLERILGH